MRRCRDAVQRAVEHRQPPGAAERLGDGRLGVAHQASKLLPGPLDVAALHGVRFPLPSVPVIGQADSPPAGEDRGAPHGDPLEARRPVVRDEHRAGGPASRQPRADLAQRTGVGQASLRPHRAVDECHPAGPGRHLRPVRRERAAVLDQLAVERVRRPVVGLEAGPVRRVEGLDADRTGPVRRLSRALHPPGVWEPPSRCASHCTKSPIHVPAGCRVQAHPVHPRLSGRRRSRGAKPSRMRHSMPPSRPPTAARPTAPTMTPCASCWCSTAGAPGSPPPPRYGEPGAGAALHGRPSSTARWTGGPPLSRPHPVDAPNQRRLRGACRRWSQG